MGSTGSIGKQTLDIVRMHPNKFRVIGLSGGDNIKLLKQQILEFKPRYFYANHRESNYSDATFSSMEEIANHPEVDVIVIATSGKAGLKATLSAVRAGKKVALANKEVLVMAGRIITSEAKRYDAHILPVDSEHSAIWQCIRGEKAFVSQIILTASGGSFYRYPRYKLVNVTVEEALKHPTWQMGKKVTVDSATLMNKGLETIEAHWFFSVPIEKIKILIHPQSIIHSLVQFVDGSTKAQLSVPDMHFPIQYALSFPKRLYNKNLGSLDLVKIKSLTFKKINLKQYPCLSIALEAGKRGGTYPAVLCAADEIAVNLFLSKEIKFTDISVIVKETIDQHRNSDDATLENILAADEWARRTALQVALKRKSC